MIAGCSGYPNAPYYGPMALVPPAVFAVENALNTLLALSGEMNWGIGGIGTIGAIGLSAPRFSVPPVFAGA
jgi:hypothetical protein